MAKVSLVIRRLIRLAQCFKGTSLLKVIGFDFTTKEPKSIDVDTDDERIAWQKAENEGITPTEVIALAPDQDPARRDRRGVVYLLSMNGYFKIGKSITPDQRYQQLKILLPEKPELVHEIQTNDVDYAERHWHLRFATQRTNGEWFKLSVNDVDEFRRCKQIIAEDPLFRKRQDERPISGDVRDFEQ